MKKVSRRIATAGLAMFMLVLTGCSQKEPGLTEFWYTPATIRQLRGNDYHAFKMFGPVYFFWWALLIACCIIGVLYFRKMSKESRQKVYGILSVLMIIDEIAKYVMTALTGQFEWGFLPFHLCSINIFVCLWHAIKPTEMAKEILYSLCIPAALVAMLSPNWICLPLNNFMHLHSAIMHLLLFLYSFLILVEGYKPKPKNIPKVFLFLICAAAVAFVINRIAGTNFFFLAGHNNNPALVLISNIFGKFYLVGLCLLVVLVVALMYLPWFLSLKRKKKSS